MQNNIINTSYQNYSFFDTNDIKPNDIVPPKLYYNKLYVFKGDCIHHATTEIFIKKKKSEFVPPNPVCNICKVSFSHDVSDYEEPSCCVIL